MKWLAIIISFYLSVLTATPAFCLSYTTVSQLSSCCNKTDCQKRNDNSNNSNGNKCVPCCIIQTCCCNLIDIPEFNFMVPYTIIPQKIPAENDKAISDYLSECWHPPE